MGGDALDRGMFSLSSPYLEGGDTLGKGPSIDLLHLGHDIFDRIGHQGHEGTVSCPVHRVSEAFDEFCGQGDCDSLLLCRGRRQRRLVCPIEGEMIGG